MKQKLARYLVDIWYSDHFTGAWLMPLGFLFLDMIRFRRFLYRIKVLKSNRLPVPVIVVGNITVGGTGKTPLTLYIAQLLKDNGYKPAIISKGYGGNGISQQVNINSTVQEVGDEPLLMAKQNICPVAVSPLRVQAAQLLLNKTNCNILIADDGLQHYALQRDIEIAVIDGERRFGNGYCLPAGPLREPINRLETVDFIVINSGETQAHEYAMQLITETAIHLITGEQKSLNEFKGLTCHAIAAIGNPQRFFKQLSDKGLHCQTHSFLDHYMFKANDIEFNDNLPVLMTQKDAMKCLNFASDKHWYVPVNAQLPEDFKNRLLTQLKSIHYDR